jgi:hypothetical protein
MERRRKKRYIFWLTPMPVAARLPFPRFLLFTASILIRAPSAHSF